MHLKLYELFHNDIWFGQVYPMYLLIKRHRKRNINFTIGPNDIIK